MILEPIKIPLHLRQKIEIEVKSGEFIRWIGQPIPRFLTPESVGVFIFGIPWTAFAIFWTYGAMGFQLPNLQKGIQINHIFSLFGVPFVLIGFAMLLTPLSVWLQAKQTVYLITEKRAIIFQGNRTVTIKSYSPKQIDNIFRREKKNGTGDVIITIVKKLDSDGDKITEEVGFMNLPNVQEVERLLKKLAQYDSD